MTALLQNQDLGFSGGRFSGWRSTHAELQVSDSFHDPEGKIDGVKKEDPLLLGKPEAHCDINEHVHRDDCQSNDEQPRPAQQHEKGEQRNFRQEPARSREW
jgi:hypothetical protein